MTVITHHNQNLGAQGEAIAAEYLQQNGYQILARNWRCGKNGELDLVARENSTIVAVEVKTRSSLAYGNPLEAITYAKSRRLRRLLVAWVREHKPKHKSIRIDAIGITLRNNDLPRIDHLQGVA